MAKPSVLYVEDNAINRLVMAKLLKPFCYVETEENGFEAIKKVETKDYDIFLIDLNLGDPNIDGFGVLKAIRALNAEAFCAAVTAYTGQEWEKKCQDAGFDLYFSKPVQANTMWEIISDYQAQRG